VWLMRAGSVQLVERAAIFAYFSKGVISYCQMRGCVDVNGFATLEAL
jgi:hypothetical protein